MAIFRNKFGEDIFNLKYKHEGCETWPKLCELLVHRVCDKYLSPTHITELIRYMSDMKFIPGGRYIYYAGRELKFFQNCYCFKAEEDTREEWARLAHDNMSALMTGGGVGNVVTTFRPKGSKLKRTGGIASGAITFIQILNEIGRRVQQGGARRSALFAALHWDHGDIPEFLNIKDWDNQFYGGVSIGELKRRDFEYNAPLDMTNISVIYDNYTGINSDIFLKNCEHALRTGEPGFSFNFENPNECLRNACNEITSEDDSDVCNLGSINLSRIENTEELQQVTYLASKFLYCGCLVGDVPTEKIYHVRQKNMRIGLGLMGVHEWLLKNGFKYEMNDKLKFWLGIWKNMSEIGANELADTMNKSRPKKYRAIAPNGTTSIIAGTTSSIEPIFAVSYKRRYLDSSGWNYQYVIDPIAEYLINQLGIPERQIETAFQLSDDYERRIRFQADVQAFVDMSISSTINLPESGTIEPSAFAETLRKYAPKLRGLTVYPNGARGGQPLVPISYKIALKNKDKIFRENSEYCKSGVCSI